MNVKTREQGRRESPLGARSVNSSGLRILVVHSHYRSAEPSGENVAVAAHVRALQRAGNDVRLVAEHTDERQESPLYPIHAALSVALGFGPSPREAITEFKPDVVHVHNLFPNFGRRWLSALETPIVHTLHNFRPLCAAGILFRDGQICTKCPDGDPWGGIRHACYHGSRAKTLPLSIANHGGVRGNVLLQKAAAIVVLSERSRRIYEAAGVAAEKLVCIPNFVAPELAPQVSDSDGGRRWLFVGRLSPEKGIDRLIEVWPEREKLTIVGEGPLKQELQTARLGKHIEFLGRCTRADVVRLMQSSIGLVFPSRWYEGFPMVYAEALAAGLPTLAFEPSAVADFVRHDESGWVTSWSDDLQDTLKCAAKRFPLMRRMCRTVFDENYTEEQFVRRLMPVYRSAIARSRS